MEANAESGGENSEPGTATPPIMRRVSEIPEATYGARQDGKLYLFNPTPADIQKALDEGRFEERGYQSHKAELEAEWLEGAAGSINEYCRLQMVYHARRIAHFVVRGWSDAIVLAKNRDMLDGTHRLKAAIHKRMDEVEVRFAG